MIPHHVYYQLAIVGLLWFCIMLHSIWPSRNAVLPQLRTEPVPLRFKRKRANEPKPFAGLTQRPHCDACEHATASRPRAPCTPPSPSSPRGGAAARYTPRAISVPIPPVAMGAGSGWAI